jgi:peptidoglycan/xylan/chitin deacetylase (PgdA/CDA1 family)
MNKAIPVAYRDLRDRLIYSPCYERPKIRWPNNARVAFWIAPNVEHYELVPQRQKLTLFYRVPPPDPQQYSIRDYGNRAAFDRFARVLDEFGYRATVSLNAGVLNHYPEIAEAMISRNWDLMGHGVYNTRNVHGLSEEEERDELRLMCDIVKKETGKPLKGVLGPSLTSNIWSPDLVAELGLLYHADWIHDDQPTPLRVRSGRLISMPYAYELGDLNPLNFDLDALTACWRAQFEWLWREGEASGRTMCLGLHPYVIAQPHAIGYLREFLAFVSGHEGVWFTTAGDIADYYMDHCYVAELDYATGLEQQLRKEAQ